MVSNIFKGLFLVVFICFTMILFGIYKNMSDDNFYYVGERIIDKRTNRIYVWVQGGGYCYFNDKGQTIYVKSLPK